MPTNIKPTLRNSINDFRAIATFLHKLAHGSAARDVSPRKDLEPLVRKLGLKRPPPIDQHSLEATAHPRTKSRLVIGFPNPPGAAEKVKLCVKICPIDPDTHKSTGPCQIVCVECSGLVNLDCKIVFY